MNSSNKGCLLGFLEQLPFIEFGFEYWELANLSSNLKTLKKELCFNVELISLKIHRNNNLLCYLLKFTNILMFYFNLYK